MNMPLPQKIKSLVLADCWRFSGSVVSARADWKAAIRFRISRRFKLEGKLPESLKGKVVLRRFLGVLVWSVCEIISRLWKNCKNNFVIEVSW